MKTLMTVYSYGHTCTRDPLVENFWLVFQLEGEQRSLEIARADPAGEVVLDSFTYSLTADSGPVIYGGITEWVWEEPRLLISLNEIASETLGLPLQNWFLLDSNGVDVVTVLKRLTR